jgi:hypothetical protein
MRGEQHNMGQMNEHRTVRGDHGKNPFKKLFAGFCDPFDHQHDDDDDDTAIDSQASYPPDSGPQVPSTSANGNHQHHAARGVKSVGKGRNPATKAVATAAKVTFGESKGSAIAQQAGAPKPAPPTEILSRFDFDGSVEITESYGPASSNADSTSELAVSNEVTRMRQRRGIEVFIMAVLFVLATLLTLRELGYSIADFEVVVKDSHEFMSGHSKKLIDIVYKGDKPAVAFEKLKVKAKEVPPEAAPSNEEESTSLPGQRKGSTGKHDEMAQGGTPIEVQSEGIGAEIEEEIQRVVDEEIVAASDGSDEL